MIAAPTGMLAAVSNSLRPRPPIGGKPRAGALLCARANVESGTQAGHARIASAFALLILKGDDRNRTGVDGFAVGRQSPASTPASLLIAGAGQMRRNKRGFNSGKHLA